ncbi:MAG TPA: hypothetical protein VMS04_11340 [Vicinamibacterales bacterium]|nr:hypothetical protein [Vicinamibacterales bacterium]
MMYAITLIILALSNSWKAGCDPAFLALFTPARSQYGSYEVCTTTESVEKTAAGHPNIHLAEAERLEALDVFGAAGSYDRSKLAYLYGGRRATVVRGWRVLNNRLESLTFISPYPDVSLTRLNSGTMIIRWTLTLAE